MILKGFLSSAKLNFKIFWSLIKEQSHSIIFLLVIGMVGIPIWFASPESDIGKNSSNIVNLIFSSLNLSKIFLATTAFFFFLSSLIKLCDPNSALSEKSANIALRGISSILIPIACYGTLLGCFMLLAKFQFSPEKLVTLGISNKNILLLFKSAVIFLTLPFLLVYAKRKILSPESKLEATLFLIFTGIILALSLLG